MLPREVTGTRTTQLLSLLQYYSMHIIIEYANKGLSVWRGVTNRLLNTGTLLAQELDGLLKNWRSVVFFRYLTALRLQLTLVDNECHWPHVMVRAQVDLPPALLSGTRSKAACVRVTVDSQGRAVVPQGGRHQGAAIQRQVKFCNMSDGSVIERDFVQNMALRNTISCLLGSALLCLYKLQCSTRWSGAHRTAECIWKTQRLLGSNY